MAYNNSGTPSLTNTIVAGNSGGDIAGSYTSSHSLVGGDPLLAALGDYGGPTSTMALLPGSPAIGTGTSNGAPNTDQRGFARGSSVDIGAYQSQGFTLIPAAGSTPQSAAVGTAFANPLAVAVKADNVGQFVNPVDGGVIGFSAPASGASAALSAATATIVNGQAGVTATAGTIVGSYSVTASVAGVTTTASFALTNTASPQKLRAQPLAAVAGPGGSLTWWWPSSLTPTPTRARAISSPRSPGVTALRRRAPRLDIADGQGRFHVLGTHTYVDAGTLHRSASRSPTTAGAQPPRPPAPSWSPPMPTSRPPARCCPQATGVEQFDDPTKACARPSPTRRQPPRPRHQHHLRPGRALGKCSPDHQADRRPSGPDQSGHHHDHRPGRQAALDPQRRGEGASGLRHRGRGSPDA